MKKLIIFIAFCFISLSAFAQQAMDAADPQSLPSQSVDTTEQSPEAWSTYLDQTATDMGPSKPLVHALAIFKKEHVDTGYAIDLGAGTGKDTLYLLKNHWKVLALDYSSKSIDIILQRTKAAGLPTPDTRVSDFETMQLPDNVDLINANLALPFVPQADFPKVWTNVVKHLRKGGIFCGNFFGQEDEFSGQQDAQMTFITKKELDDMFKGFQIESLTSRQGFYPQADGQSKYWQIWDVVAKKV